MSTKKEMLGKENRKENGHRRYSLLLLALLFIGFASYGTYAYFTSSTSTTRGQLTLNGLNSSYDVDKDDIGNQNTGDGTSNTSDDNTNNDKEFNQDKSGNGDGTFKEVTGDNVENSTKFGEFPWVYVGNNAGNDVASDELLKQSFDLKQFNGHVFATDDTNTEFNNVVEGDVFRKTVRLAVNGTSQVPMTAKITWKNADSESTANIIGGAFYRTAAQVNNAAATFDLKQFKPAFDLNSADAIEIGKVKSGDFIDVELVVAVKKGVNTEAKADIPLNLAEISRQLEISLVQETSNVLKDK
ncbi:hypothetical protein ACN08A_02200 [Enterococcus cecorum]|uniref:Camelysin metallo-endopeptidase n=1 Tax=Enterococcus cecorum TaxID=44008 RepID=A0AAW8TTZ2_9ENTE|nr:hypothetical protein [Enterococcus cecorum]MDT2796330.1 hypothetical protein [Enterococcus cecorum]